MEIDFIGLQDIEMDGSIALLKYSDGREVRFDFDTDEQKSDFKEAVESFVQEMRFLYTINLN